jgi:hypothetical protein
MDLTLLAYFIIIFAENLPEGKELEEDYVLQLLPIQIFSIATAQALYSAVNVSGSKTGFVSQFAQPSLK